jgi:hypothetical protein
MWGSSLGGWTFLIGRSEGGVAAFDGAGHRFRLGGDHPEQRGGRAGGGAAALLVLLDRIDVEAEPVGELFLAQP